MASRSRCPPDASIHNKDVMVNPPVMVTAAAYDKFSSSSIKPCRSKELSREMKGERTKTPLALFCYIPGPLPGKIFLSFFKGEYFLSHLPPHLDLGDVTTAVCKHRKSKISRGLSGRIIYQRLPS